MPSPTAAPVPTTTPTAAPEPTTAPTPSPSPTAQPEPDSTEAPTVAPNAGTTAPPEAAPTTTPEPEPESEPPDDPIAVNLAPLGDNLLWVAHYDNSTQRLSVYDPSGAFSPEMILPPGQESPDASEIDTLTNPTPGQIYILSVAQDQTVDLQGNRVFLAEGTNFILWR